MQQNVRAECPKCSRPLQKFNGHIGYCTQHKWVSPVGLGFDAEAAEQNQQDASAIEQSRLERERLEQAVKAQEIRERHLGSVRKIVAVVIALALIAGAAAFFIVRPSMNYNNAIKKVAACEYQAAWDIFRALDNYKDSASRTLLCEAMIDLQKGAAEDAVAKFDQLVRDGQNEVVQQLADSLLPIISDWKEKGLTPQTLFLLLRKVDTLDPNKTLNIAKLTEEGHTALLDGTQLSTYTNDINSDGEPELVVLKSDYTVAVYRMSSDSNVPIAIDNSTAAACEMVFGNQYKDTDVTASVRCFSEAYRLLPDDESRFALAFAYQLRSASYENASDMTAAIADARRAMETAGTAEAFAFFYDINLRNCKNGHDTATAIAMWDVFAESSKAELVRFSAMTHWQADAAQLHITRALELAAQQNDLCVAELRTAAKLGANITDAITKAESHFELGLTLAHLRLMEIELLDSEPSKEQALRSNLATEVRTAIHEWKLRGIAPTDVPVLIYLADQQGIDFAEMNRDAIYEEAALAAAGNISQHTFVDWNRDGYEELLTLDASGNLSLYAINETWKVVSSIDTKLSGSSYFLADESAPLILILSSEKDELLAVTGTSENLNSLFREQDIRRYAMNGSTVTFSRQLEGSIVRYEDYTYEAAGITNRPVRTGIDWQQNDYPQPDSAVAAVQRYFEARAYNIPDEAALLTDASATNEFFSATVLASLPAPDLPGTVNAIAYQTESEQVLFEVTYPFKAQLIRTWISVKYINGWKLTGTADTYGANVVACDIDDSIPLISLNVETVDTVSKKGVRNTYRLLIPSSGRIQLLWQSGSKSISRTSHTVTMFHGSLTGDTVFSFQLQPSPNKQQSKDVFVSAGVYYVTVEANVADAEPYRLTIRYDTESHVELENNDTPASATSIEFNTAYSGVLSNAKDVDYFSFALDAASAVHVTFGAPGNGNKSTTHTLTVIHAADGKKLSSVSVPGNVLLSETGNLYLSPGAYLVQVAKGNTFTNDEYRLTVNVDQNGNMESEPNDTPETANTVPINEDIHASTGQEGDVDCFAFILDGDAVVQPRFTFTPTDSSSKTYVLTIMDASRRELLKVNIGGKESAKVIAPVALTAGTYTVKIENPRFVRQDYTLRLVSMAVDHVEKEPNDSTALATTLAVGQPRTGVLTTDVDVDYYKATFSEQTTVMLRFSFTQNTNRNTAFVLTVEQNGKTQWTANIKGDSGGIEQQLQFPAGEYYIKVKPSTWMGVVYTITLE